MATTTRELPKICRLPNKWIKEKEVLYACSHVLAWIRIANVDQNLKKSLTLLFSLNFLSTSCIRKADGLWSSHFQTFTFASLKAFLKVQALLKLWAQEYMKNFAKQGTTCYCLKKKPLIWKAMQQNGKECNRRHLHLHLHTFEFSFELFSNVMRI